jgi:Protein of unknown function (DUF1264)
MHRRALLSALGVFGVGAMGNSVGAEEGHAAAPHSAGDAPISGPLAGPHAHFCGIHVAKKDPKSQLIVQHYCAAHTETGHGDALFQCILFDSREKNAKLLGVEYIISDKEYRRLAEEEQKFWHPHTYEVLGGGLIAPGMAEEEERKFMKDVLTTWGKTWHTWPDPRTAVPIGEPLLIWSLTGDGQADERVVAERDRQFNVSTAKIRERRGREIGLAVPQIPLPKTLAELGRQWTATGEDKPTPRK